MKIFKSLSVLSVLLALSVAVSYGQNAAGNTGTMPAATGAAKPSSVKANPASAAKTSNIKKVDKKKRKPAPVTVVKKDSSNHVKSIK